VSSLLGYPRIFNFARALRDSLLFTTTTSNKSSRFILAKSKIHRRHKCVGLKMHFIALLRHFVSCNDFGFPPTRE
jgi:hypothetical protein